MVVRIFAGPQFKTWFGKVARNKEREYELAVALLAELRDLEAPPEEESPTFKRVRQAKRHEIWRIAHPYEAGYAVRVLVWFPPEPKEVAVIALIGGNKSAIGDLWYDSAVPRAEDEVDGWKRDRGRGTEA